MHSSSLQGGTNIPLCLLLNLDRDALSLILKLRQTTLKVPHSIQFETEGVLSFQRVPQYKTNSVPY